MSLDQMLTVRDENVDDEPLEYRTLRSWTPEEDELLIKNVRRLGKKWHLIANLIPDRTINSIRNRYNALYK